MTDSLPVSTDQSVAQPSSWSPSVVAIVTVSSSGRPRRPWCTGVVVLVRQSPRLARASADRSLADGYQLVDRILGQGAVDHGGYHQLVQCDRALVIVKERGIRGVAAGGDAHQALPRR